MSLANELLAEVARIKNEKISVTELQSHKVELEQPARPAVFKKWRPKKWEVNYEQIVILSTLGKDHSEIAQMFGFTPQHISNIVQCPEAQVTRRIVLEKLRASAADKIPAHLDDLADKALQRLRQLLFDDDLFKEHPFAVVDRGIGVLKGVNRLKGDSPSTVIGNQTNIGKAVMFPPELAREISEGLKLAREARELNPIELLPAGEVIAEKNGTEG